MERVFQLFPKLPIELRLVIWEQALPGPRVVNLTRKKLKKTVGDWERENGANRREDIFLAAGMSSAEVFLDLHKIYNPNDEGNGKTRLSPKDSNAVELAGFESNTEPPNILFACRESRDLALKHYQLAFSSFGSIPQTYFDFSLDTLYIRGENFLLNDTVSNEPNVSILDGVRGLWGLKAMDLLQVRRLAIEVDTEADDFNDWGDDREAFISNLLQDVRELETLTIVVDHNESLYLDGSCPDQSELAFIEPWRIKKVLREYSALFMGPWEYSEDDLQTYYQHLEQKEADLVEKLDMSYLKESSRDPTDVNPGWNLPALECKVAIAKDLKDMLLKLMAKTEDDRKDEHNAGLPIWAEFYGPIHLHHDLKPSAPRQKDKLSGPDNVHAAFFESYENGLFSKEEILAAMMSDFFGDEEM